MEIREIKYLQQFVNDGTISLAAKRLHLTPQGLLKALRTAEKNAQISLIEHHQGTLTPSKEAHLICSRATPLLEEHAVFESYLHEMSVAGSSARHLTIGIIHLPQRATPFTELELSRLVAGISGYKIELIRASSEACVSGLLADMIDAAIIIGSVSDPRITCLQIGACEPCIILKNGHPLATTSSLTLSQISLWPIARPLDLRCGYKTIKHAFELRCLTPSFYDIGPASEAYEDFLAFNNGLVFADSHSELAQQFQSKRLCATDRVLLPLFFAYRAATTHPGISLLIDRLRSFEDSRPATTIR